MHRLAVAGALSLGCCGLAHLWFHRSYTLDDAYITYRYSRNFAHGLGLVYNPGDYVKGYSNTLYTLLMSVPELFGRDPNPFSKCLGFAAFVWIAVTVWRLYARESDRALWTLAFLASSTALAVHCTSGLETGSYTALLFAAVARRLEEQRKPEARPWSALLFGAVVISRPEGILLFAAMAAHDACLRILRRRLRAPDLLFFALPPLVYLLELGLSYRYYGDFFPQTYHAKTRPVHGVLEALQMLGSDALQQLQPGSYLAQGLDATGFGLPLLAALPLALLPAAHRRQNAALLAIVLAQLVFIARAGSDWAPAFRFGVPLLPVLLCLLAELIALAAGLARRYRRPAGYILALAALGLGLPRQLAESAEIQRVRYVNAENKLSQGAYFATLAPAGITLSSFDIGGQGYAANGFDVLDAGGLTTREMVGCSGHAPPRCVRYAELVRPELVRLHNNKKRDAYIAKAVTKLTPYLALDEGRLLLERALVLGGELPAQVQAHEPAADGGAVSLGSDLPPAVPVWQQRQVTLYWRRGEGSVEGVAERGLEWWSAGARYSALASESVWRHAQLGDWRVGELFADRVTLRTPPRPGSYRLQLIAAGKRTDVARCEVLAEPAARAMARQWLARGSAQGEYWDSQALQLSAAASTEAQRRSAQRARSLRSQAAQLIAAGDLPGALRLLQEAKRQTHRMAWLAGTVTGDLRLEIDANAALRRDLIGRLLASQSR
jgi:hypothetical protein